MAHKRNNGTDEINAVQNRFTAHLHHAVHNGRQENHAAWSGTLKHLAESGTLQWALRAIQERERHILLARVIDEKDFVQIGAEVGLSSKGSAVVYYRTIAKLRQLIGENANRF